jgi:hypothetical protein
MKRKPLAIAILLLAAAGWAAYDRYVPGRTPAGQPPLADLDPASFEAQFRAASGEMRLLVLLSPT